MKTHHYIIALDKEKDDMFDEGKHSVDCGKRIPFENITNDITEVDCLSCLKSIVWYSHDGIREMTRGIHEFSEDIKTANAQLINVQQSRVVDALPVPKDEKDGDSGVND